MKLEFENKLHQFWKEKYLYALILLVIYSVDAEVGHVWQIHLSLKYGSFLFELPKFHFVKQFLVLIPYTGTTKPTYIEHKLVILYG